MGRATRLAAWSAHACTALGALCGVRALFAIHDGETRTAFLWLAAAALIDGLDGPLARRLRAREVLPALDGALLDNLVDYLTYVVAPAVLLAHEPLLPPGLARWTACGVCVAAAWQFSRSDAKTEDGFFTGFPSCWNLVALYLWLLRPDPWLALGLVALLCVLSLVPLRFVHPLRMRRRRGFTWPVGAAGAACLAIALLQAPDPQPGWVWASLACVACYVAIGLHLARGRSRGATRATP
jgi:phosphatidylcholine synthase